MRVVTFDTVVRAFERLLALQRSLVQTALSLSRVSLRRVRAAPSSSRQARRTTEADGRSAR